MNPFIFNFFTFIGQLSMERIFIRLFTPQKMANVGRQLHNGIKIAKWDR